MIGFCSVHCRLALTAGDGLDWMLTVKVSREKDVDLLLAACKFEEEQRSSDEDWRLVLQRQQPLLLTRNTEGTCWTPME